MNEAWRQIGQLRAGGVLLIGDHAANAVPTDIGLGIAPEWLDLHIALDIGVAEVAALLVNNRAVDCAVLGGVSRLVIDLNREEDHDGLVPRGSDGRHITGNMELAESVQAARVARFYAPYHAHLDGLIEREKPSLILSLHSFTQHLSSQPDVERPWDIGILYNQDDRLAASAITHLSNDGWQVGDQLPYSGKLLNATMNRHAEARGIAYIGVEMRQDHSGAADGQAAMAASLTKMMAGLRNLLA